MMTKFKYLLRIFICSVGAFSFASCTTTSPKPARDAKALAGEKASVLEVKNGLSQKVVDRELTTQIDSLCDCMDSYVRRTKKGRVENRIKFKITKIGMTNAIALQNNGDKKLYACMQEGVSSWVFPKRENIKENRDTEVIYQFKPIEHCKSHPASEQQEYKVIDDDGMSGVQAVDKPVIYLYPPHEMDVSVILDYEGILTATYPAYDPAIKGWSVRAKPDGTLQDLRTGREYSYLFWEGLDQALSPDITNGFVVRGADVEEFLVHTLAKIGLKPREYNEFIVFWLPLLKDNPYNLIHFEGKTYAARAKLTITPTPEHILRVMMLVRPLTAPISIEPQVFPPFTRRGFTVVEWGGSLLKK